jgi:ATP-dependent Clp protease ATP-binding subunit ClpA
MMVQESAILSIMRNKTGTDYTFTLSIPGQVRPVVEQSPILEGVETGVKASIVQVAQSMSSHAPEGQQYLEELGFMLSRSLPMKIVKSLHALQCPLLIDTNDPTVPWELSYDGREFLFARKVLGWALDVNLDQATPAVALAGEELSCLIIDAPRIPETVSGMYDELELSPQQLGPLLQVMEERFSLEEIKKLCFLLGIDYENLPGQGKLSKIMDLLSYMLRYGRVFELLKKCQELRSDIEWSGMIKDLYPQSAQEPQCASVGSTNGESSDVTACQTKVGALRDFFERQGADVVCLLGEQATTRNVLQNLNDKIFHIIHICGRVEFDRDKNARIALAGGKGLTMSDITQSLQGAPLVFADTYMPGRSVGQGSGMPRYHAKAMGFPSAFMNARRGSASAFIGVPWALDDSCGGDLALPFYGAFFSGETAGAALRSAREEMRTSVDDLSWAAFMLWGLPELGLFSAKATSTDVVDQPQPKASSEEVEEVWPEERLNQSLLSDSGRLVFSYAELEMASMGANLLTTVFLFIGLTKVENGVTQAALCRQGFNPEDTRDVLRLHASQQTNALQVFSSFFGEPEPGGHDEAFGLSDSVEEIIELAVEEAYKDSKSDGVEERHLLLGFLKQGGGTTRGELEDWGIDWDALNTYAHKPTGELGQEDAETAPRHPLFDEQSLLKVDRLSDDVQEMLAWAWRQTRRGAAGYLATPYLVEAICEKGSCFGNALADQGGNLAKIKAVIHDILHNEQLSSRSHVRDELRLYDLSRRVQKILRLSYQAAEAEGSAKVTEPYLLLGLLRDGGGSAGKALRKASVDLKALETFVWKKCLGKTAPSVSAPREEGETEPFDKEGHPLFDSDGNLKLDACTAGAQRALQGALAVAQREAASHIDTYHVILFMLESGIEGLLPAALLQNRVMPSELHNHLKSHAWPFAAGAKEPSLTRSGCSDGLLNLLSLAHRAAQAERAVVGERHLLSMFLSMKEDSTSALVRRLSLDLDRVRRALVQHSLFDSDGCLLQGCLSETVRSLLAEAAQMAALLGYGGVGTPHLLIALLSWPESRLPDILRKQECNPGGLRTAVLSAIPAGPQPFRFRSGISVQTSFSPRALRILQLADDEAKREGADSLEETHLLLGFARGVDGVTRSALQHSGVDIAGLERAILAHKDEEASAISKDARVLQEDVFLPEGALNQALFDEPALRILAQAVEMAHDMRHEVVGTPHLFIGLTRPQEGYTHAALLAQGISPDAVQQVLLQMFQSPAAEKRRLPKLVRDGCSASLFRILYLARDLARERMIGAISERDLLHAFLLHGGGRSGEVLENLGLDFHKLLAQLRKKAE